MPVTLATDLGRINQQQMRNELGDNELDEWNRLVNSQIKKRADAAALLLGVDGNDDDGITNG